MDADNMADVAGLVGKAYAQQAAEAGGSIKRVFHNLLHHRKCPLDGWDERTIEMLLHELSMLDSNNFLGNVGVGEREARIASSLVARRHYYMGHGVGRSGDIAAIQPKAAGSSVIAQLTNYLTLDLAQSVGLTRMQGCIVVPVATGMAMVLVLLTLRERRPSAKYVVWPRIDQKSCFKSILAAGFEPLVIENVLEGDELRTDVSAVEQAIAQYGVDAIACVMTTTSCFAPRGCDRVEDVAKLCKALDVPHVINNAYGLQSSKCNHIVNESVRVGRVDSVVQSTDKNLMVPVGGAIILGPDKKFISAISKIYPGRASSSPALDVFITLLQLGINGYKKLMAERKRMYDYLKEKLTKFAEAHGERVLHTPNNPISIGLSLTSLPPCGDQSLTFFGSMLFSRGVSGTRVIVPQGQSTIGPRTFKSYGAHFDSYPCAYLTAAAAMGVTERDVDLFIARLDKAFDQYKRHAARTTSTSVPTQPANTTATTATAAADQQQQQQEDDADDGAIVAALAQLESA
eukprot:m.27107 g.27107  ORF g.27107 m.27107 type:complete len:516 (+) comp10035_c0_seq1:1396-2943(+)